MRSRSSSAGTTTLPSADQAWGRPVTADTVPPGAARPSSRQHPTAAATSSAATPLAPRDGEHALDLGERRRRRTEPAPDAPDGPARDAPRRSARADGASPPASASSASAELVEQVRLGPQHRRPDGRAPGRDRARAPSPSSGQHLVPDPVPAPAHGRAFDGSSTGASPRAATTARTSARRRRRAAAARWCRAAARHAGEPARAAPAQQVQQHGLGLVVGGVGDEHRGRAELARARLRSAA